MIPKLFYQSWDEDIPKEILDKTMQHLPADMKYIRYSLHDIKKYLFQRWGPRTLDVFNKYKVMAHKIDLWRYFMLYDTGGVYMDADCVLLNDLPETLFEKEAVFCTNNRGVKDIFNGFFMITPNHPILRTMINYMMHTSTIPKQTSYYFNCQELYRVVRSHRISGGDIKILFDKQFPDGLFYVLHDDKCLLVEQNALYPYKKS